MVFLSLHDVDFFDDALGTIKSGFANSGERNGTGFAGVEGVVGAFFHAGTRKVLSAALAD